MIPQAMPVTLHTTGLDTTGTRSDGQFFADPSTGAVIAVGFYDPLEEPYWLDDLDLARRHLAREYAPIGCLIEANPITLDGVQGMAQLWKRPIPDQEHGLIFGVTVFLAKTTLTAHIMYWMDERLLGTTGMREAVVSEKLMQQETVTTDATIHRLLREPHPYDPELHGRLPFNRADHEAWDELFPGHPLTCVRAWLRDLDRIVTVDPAFAAFPDFRGTTRQAEAR